MFMAVIYNIYIIKKNKIIHNIFIIFFKDKDTSSNWEHYWDVEHGAYYWYNSKVSKKVTDNFILNLIIYLLNYHMQTGESQWSDNYESEYSTNITNLIGPKVELQSVNISGAVDLSVDCYIDPQDFEERWKSTAVHSVEEFQLNYFPSEERITECLAWRKFWVIAFGEKLPIIRCYAYAQAVGDSRYLLFNHIL